MIASQPGSEHARLEELLVSFLVYMVSLGTAERALLDKKFTQRIWPVAEQCCSEIGMLLVLALLHLKTVFLCMVFL